MCGRLSYFTCVFIATGWVGVNRFMLQLAAIWAECVCLCLFAAVWSWTSSSRRTSCSRWWRGFALWRTATSPLCLTPRRPSPPPRNASPKLTPRSTLAGNFGSCEKRHDSFLPNHAQDLCVRPGICLLYPSSSVLSHLLGFFVDLLTTGYRTSRLSEMTGCVMGHKCGFHGYFTMSCLPKKTDSELFWTNFFKQGVKLHQGIIFGDQQGEKTNLISHCLFAYIFLADVYGVPFYDNGSVIVTFIFTSRDFVFLPSLQERLAGQPQRSEVYINSISPYCKAQLTLFRICFLQNN